MEDNDFLTWKISINYQISQMEEYLQTIEEEKEKSTILDDLIISLSISLQ